MAYILVSESLRNDLLHDAVPFRGVHGPIAKRCNTFSFGETKGNIRNTHGQTEATRAIGAAKTLKKCCLPRGEEKHG